MRILRKHAKIGLVHFMAYPEVIRGDGPVLETLRSILVDDYFDVVEITRIADNAKAKQAAALLEQSHVTVAFGAQPVLLINKLNLNALDAAERLKAVEAVKICYEQAAVFGAEGVAVLAGPCDAENTDEGMKVLIDSLIDLANTAAGYNLKLALEVFDEAIDKQSLVGKSDIAKKVGQAVRDECSNFGLMHDLSHLPLLNETPTEALKPIRDLLTHVHIGNAYLADKGNPAYGDQHPRFGLPGGVNDIPELVRFLQTLYEIGYLGSEERRIISFEVKPLAGEESELVIANAKRTLNEAALQLQQI